MYALTKIRAVIHLTMLTCAGTLSVPLAVHAEGDAAAGEKQSRRWSAVNPRGIANAISSRGPECQIARGFI